jgi:hypothetical protein
MGQPELVGRAELSKEDMAEAADSPAGWSRELWCNMQSPANKDVMGENGQVSASGERAERNSFCADSQK